MPVPSSIGGFKIEYKRIIMLVLRLDLRLILPPHDELVSVSKAEFLKYIG